MAEKDPIITLKDVDFYYEKGKPIEVHALKNVNLEIERGEFVSFFGPSGCGKSTMLYAIAGIENPDNGEVIVNNQNLAKLDPKELAVFRQMGIGIVFQNFNLIPSISIIDNIMLPMAFLGIPLELRKKRSLEILTDMGISAVANRYPYELSGGQQQRVGIARAIANDPPLILADEPTGNLDSVNAVKTLELLRDFSVKQGKTVILVTHESWSLKYVNTIFYMKDGEVIRTEKRTPTYGGGPVADSSLESAEEAKVQAISAFILKGHVKEEIKRFEEILLKRMGNQITPERVLEDLDMPFKEGGVGLWKSKAKKVAEIVEEIVRSKAELHGLMDKLTHHPDWSLHKDMEDIRKWVMGDYAGDLSLVQIEKVDEGIKGRLKNSMNTKAFQELLAKPIRDGGAGLKVMTSLKASERFEDFLAMESAPALSK